jgi:FO synthase
MHALARILLHPLIPNIQVSWVKLGVDGAQIMLRSGCNDFGGTLMEETISRMAGAAHGIRLEPSQIDDAIRAIGRTPARRTTTYDRITPVVPAVPS